MKSIVITLRSLSSGDAIGNDVISEYNLLKSNGLEVFIFAEHYEPQFAQYLCDFDTAKNSEVLIYHHGILWDKGETLLKDHHGKFRIMRYHNITPPDFFRAYNDELTDLVDKGRKQTLRLIKYFSYFIPASFYNAQELLNYKVPKELIEVIAPFNHVDELLSIQADIVTLDKLIGQHRPIVLFVGRKVPNKGLFHFVRVAKKYVDLFGKKVYFIWVGSEDLRLGKYYDMINRYINDNSISDVVLFPGKVSISELKSYYLSANVFLILSEHEGFCVPILEAQSLGVPIIALNRAAVGETLGKNQLLFDEIDYERFAAAIEVLLNNNEYCIELSKYGKENYNGRFKNSLIKEKFLNTITGVLKI